MTVKPYRAATPDELDRALTAIVSDRMDGMLNFQGGLSLSVRQVIVDFAAKHRLPAIYQATMFAKAGDLAVKRPARYYLTINAGAAREIGIALPVMSNYSDDAQERAALQLGEPRSPASRYIRQQCPCCFNLFTCC